MVKNITGTKSGTLTSRNKGYKVKMKNCKTDVDKAKKCVDAAKEEGRNVSDKFYPNGIKYNKYIYIRGNFKKSYRFLKKVARCEKYSSA